MGNVSIVELDIAGILAFQPENPGFPAARRLTLAEAAR